MSIELIAIDLDGTLLNNEKKINLKVKNTLAKAKEKGIKGKESTPFLLAKVKEITEGTSLDANIELVYNNAKVGAQIAVELAKLNN